MEESKGAFVTFQRDFAKSKLAMEDYMSVSQEPDDVCNVTKPIVLIRPRLVRLQRGYSWTGVVL